jgi:hypothetical protein
MQWETYDLVMMISNVKILKGWLVLFSFRVVNVHGSYGMDETLH